MGLARSLRNVADRLAGFADDDFDDTYEEEPGAALQSSQRAERPLVLVGAPRLAFGLVAPRTFDEAQQIADRFRGDVPVVVDLQGCEEELARRLIDFCSGLTYALEGSLQLVDERTLLLAPSHIELSGEATVGLRPKGFFNQI